MARSKDQTRDQRGSPQASSDQKSSSPLRGKKRGSDDETQSVSLVNQMIGLTTQLTSGAIDIAKSGKFNPLVFGDRWVKYAYRKNLDPARLQAMAEAGDLLRDAREVAGMNIADVADAVGLTDSELLEDVEKGVATLPFDMMLRIASLIARHDPIPFIIKFLRTYNPDLEQLLSQWGITQFPLQYERERRFINIYRKHDELRKLTDPEYDRFIDYMSAATDLTSNMMMRERDPDKKAPEKREGRKEKKPSTD